MSKNSTKRNYQGIPTGNPWNPVVATPGPPRLWKKEASMRRVASLFLSRLVVHLPCALVVKIKKIKTMTRCCSVRPLLPLVWCLHPKSGDVAAVTLQVSLAYTMKLPAGRLARA